MKRTILISESKLINIIENNIKIINHNHIGDDWDPRRIVNQHNHGKFMYVKTPKGFKQIKSRGGQQDVYFLTKDEAAEANKLLKQIRELTDKLKSIVE